MGKLLGKRPLGKLSRRLENVKMGLREIDFDIWRGSNLFGIIPSSWLRNVVDIIKYTSYSDNVSILK
jgi:hypothetical protein